MRGVKLGYRQRGSLEADDGVRTRDPQLGNLVAVTMDSRKPVG
jgi:hypothetical protein